MTGFLYFSLALVFLLAGILFSIFFDSVNDGDADSGFLLGGLLCIAFGVLLCFIHYDFARTEEPIEFTPSEKIDTLVRFNDGVRDTTYVLTFKK